VLRDLRRRGMRAPTLAVGDGALGFWAALRDVFPDTVEARCWAHKAANVLNALPRSAQPAARKALAEIRDAEDPDHALAAITVFEADHGAKWPKAFATVRLRTKVTKGPGSRAVGLAMAYKLIEAAQDRWRSVNAPHLVALVRAGASYRNGVLVEGMVNAA
jgi:hypothetical protein